MHQIQVDPQGVRSAASVVTERAGAVDEVARRVGDALRQVAEAGGQGSLQDSAHRASRAWGEGLTELATAGTALAAGMESAAAAYDAVEGRQLQRFDAGGGS